MNFDATVLLLTMGKIRSQGRKGVEVNKMSFPLLVTLNFLCGVTINTEATSANENNNANII